MAWSLRKQATMLSTALRNKHEGGSQVPRSTGRSRGRAATEKPTLKAVASESEATDAVDAGSLGDVAGLPLGRIPDGGDDEPATGAAPGESAEPAEPAAATVEPSLSDYSTI